MTGQWMVSADGRRWYFDSGSLALDFGYTGDYGYGVAEWERLHGPGDLGSWLCERFGPLAEEEPTHPQFAAALRLRSAVSAVALALADARPPSAPDIDVINEAAQAPPVRPRLPGGTLPVPRPTVTEALSSIAGDAVEKFAGGSERLRRCSADNCALVFYDASRPNARRWCSMRRCGNRSKVRTHRAQTDTAAP